MIQIDQVDHIPQLVWTKHCSSEFRRGYAYEVEKQSTVIWQISFNVPIVVAGLIYKSLTNPPWLWFLLTHDFEGEVIKHMRWMKRMVHHLPAGTMTGIASDFKEGKRFAEFFGFEPVHYAINAYDVYRRA